MVTLLERLLLKQREFQDQAEERRSYGMLCSLLGIVLNVFLFLIKYTAGGISGSIAIMADAFNNLSDAGSSVITLVGFRFAGLKPDAHHPFGHGRIEYVSGFIVSVLIILMGVELLKDAVGKIMHPEAVETGALVIGILLVSILVKIYMFYYNRTVGIRIESEAMKATGIDSLSDSVSTAVVLLAMLITHFTGKNVDGWCGLLVSCFVLYAGYSAAKDTLNPLLGQPPSPEFVDRIRTIVLSHPEILGLHDLVVHDYGPGRCFISLHGEVSGSGDIFAIHEVIDKVEKELNEKLGCEAVIHMDPIEVDNTIVGETKKQVAEMIRHAYPDLTIHDFRMVQGPNQTNLIFDVVIPFGSPETEEELQVAIPALVRERWENYNSVIQIEHSYI